MPFSIIECVSGVINQFELAAKAKGLELVAHLDDDLPVCVLGDSDRLRQILINLTSNAIKFTLNGDVTIEARTFRRTPRESTVRFAVSDTGSGIPADQQELIFEPFRQVDASATRRYGGTGLGLTIAHRLIGLMGGDLKLESEPGRGTRITFELPLPIAEFADAPRKPADEASDFTLAPIRVLLAEDNPINQRLVSRLLERRGHQVDVAPTGVEALKCLDSTKYDLVLMDVHMPEMDGLAVTRVIRERESRSGGHMPVLAMTANAMRGDREKCIDAGMDDYVSKPIRVEALLRAIHGVIPKPELTGVGGIRRV